MDLDQIQYDDMDYDEACDEIKLDNMDYEDMFRKFWTMASCVMTLIMVYYYKYVYKEPCMTSSLTGEIWIKELINGHPIRCVNALRMEPDLFVRLSKELYSKYGLRPSNRMSIFEKVGIFLYTLALGVSNRVVGERFQRSGDTISRVFHEVLNAISGPKGLAYYIIRPRDPKFQHIPPQIANDDRYMPYFKVIKDY